MKECTKAYYEWLKNPYARRPRLNTAHGKMLFEAGFYAGVRSQVEATPVKEEVKPKKEE